MNIWHNWTPALDAKIAPYQEHRTRLLKIPGVDRVLATVIIAEVGTDMSVFKSRWTSRCVAGVCPGKTRAPVNANEATLAVETSI